MAQRDKVKELVGRGLNSYHTKALQQMDRIEKKNKEQNHKISILSNSLDNDYLTKTEEGSVISLEHSKEGMVYLDELQGNTLVNYCTDGSKEITLNGDIDVEGTFVTTTEGVDNGKVDVLCEGNTLVNLKLNSGEKCHVAWQNSNTVEFFTLNENSCYHLKGEIVETSNVLKFGWCYGALGKIKTELLKPNTTYTLILNNSYDWIKNFSLMEGNATNNYHKTSRKISKNIYTITTKDSFEGLNANRIILYGHIDGGYKGKVDCSVVAMLEGDWSEKEIPTEFFEGMKSVGQDDENGHKIEILSRNKNLWDINDFDITSGIYSGVEITRLDNGFKFNGVATGIYTRHCIINYLDKFELGKTYTLTGDYFLFENTYADGHQTWRKDVTVTKDLVKVSCYMQWLDSSVAFDNLIVTPQIEEGTVATTYVKSNYNKKEISLNEPLRKGNTEVKDRIIKLNNRWYVERNYEEIVLDGSYTWKINSNGTIYYATSIFSGNKYVLPTINNKMCNMVCDKRIVTYIDYMYAKEPNSIVGYIGITKDGNLGMSLDDKTPEQIKSELTSNPIRIILQLKTPIYEPLEVEPVLNTYNDITYISNNSIIPCNMKVKNSGYNAIIKPNTLYTVALDTNKGGTIGMNLGGAKATTTNNVAKITTPATLADDSLRLYGKGIKSSKVRLLEGDKTNWIPSHFEGMKSSFEDKVQEDNSYKMEILSNNKNLFDVNTYHSGSAMIEFKNHGFRLYTTNPRAYCNAVFNIKVKPFTNYRIYTDFRVTSGNALMDVYTKSNKWLANTNGAFNTKDNTELSFRFYCSGSTPSVGDVQYSNIRLIEVGNNTDFVEHKHNKIQFSSIEPLRRVGNSKDKLVFKDNKLMIERNTKQTVLAGNTTEGWSEPSSHTTSNKCLLFSSKTTNELKTHSRIYSDRFMTPNETNAGDSSLWQIDREGIGHSIYNDVRIRIDRERLTTPNKAGFVKWLSENPTKIVCELAEPTYEEIPYELQKIILEGYENGTLFLDTNIPPTATVTYAGETPIVKATKLNKTEVLNNTEDINDNIIPYLMDMDYRVVMLQLATEELEGGVSMARLFGGTYEMLKRDILSKRLSRQEYGYRLADYFNAGKLTEEQVKELEELR